MRKTLVILRRKLDGQLTVREVAGACQVSPSTVCDALARFEASQLPWPLPGDMSEDELERRLYYHPDKPGFTTVVEGDRPDYSVIHEELRKKHVTLQLLWKEYKQVHPNGYNYSYYCEQYAAWRNQLEPVMRQTHVYGHKCFVDYAGDTVPVIDPETGEVRQAQIFIGVLGASNYTYAEAVWTQDSPSWLRSHVRMLNFFQGAPRVLVPDNLKSGVSKADRYEPEIHPAYQRLADHYELVVLPARVRRPKDKAKVEGAVLIAERWILAALRDRQFFGLNPLEVAIGELLENLNGRPFQKMSGSRRERFESRERAALQSLPTEAFVLRECQRMRVPEDYHLSIDEHLYSVPYRLIGEVVEVWLCSAMVEVCLNNRRVALHARSYTSGGQTRLEEHMPIAHREVSQWTPDRMLAWANKIGVETAQVIEAIIAAKPHPEMAVNACLGVLRQAKRHSAEALEAACHRALAAKTPTYKSVKSILDKGLHRQPLPDASRGQTRPRVQHENVRGAGYYQMTLGEDEQAC